MNKKKIILVCGDPNSINSEIIFKSWKKLNNSVKKKIYVISNKELLEKQFKKLNCRIKIKDVKSIEEKVESNELKIINVDLKFKDPFNVNKRNASTYVKKCLGIGHKLALEKNILGLINCAIDKRLLRKNLGVTEFLANKCKITNNSEVMMIRNNKLSVCPITTHINLKNVPAFINSKKIIIKINTVQKWFLKLFKKKPKIGVLGLNPHNAELDVNSEEVKEIAPAIKRLKKKGFKIKGPLVPDTTFVKNYKNFDVIIGMYHDQVLTPFKSLFKFDGVNLTLGLKYLRLSPDHGVAKDIIKKNKASPSSLIDCIKFLNNFG